MDFVFIANAWGAGVDNPTSKHRIALELARRGHRVLWVEGAGMRTPSLSSGSDRGRIARKVRAAWSGARPACVTAGRKEAQGTQEGKVGIWVLSPLSVPLPRYERIRRLNGAVYAWAARRACRQLGFVAPVLVNYVPVLAEAMTRWMRTEDGGQSGPVSKLRLFRDLKTLSRALSVTLSTKLTTKAPLRGVLRDERTPRDDGVKRGRREVGGQGDWGQKSEDGGRVILDTRHSTPPVVYHCVDRWDAFAMYDSALMNDMDARCCRYADVVIASSNDLFDRCRGKNANTHLVMHGVDYEHFAKAVLSNDLDREAAVPPGEAPGVANLGGSAAPPTGANSSLYPAAGRPADLPEGPIVGFFGLLSEWLDQELLLKLSAALRETRVNAQQPTPNNQRPTTNAQQPTPNNQHPTTNAQQPTPNNQRPTTNTQHPTPNNERPTRTTEQAVEGKPPASLVLIGAADVDVSRLENISNIHLLGPKPFAELPGYVAHFTVGIIPFVINDLTRAVNPIKLREMMAAGCPVVSTALPEVEKYATGERVAGSVHVAHSREDFMSAVAERLATPSTLAQRRALSERMRAETWSHKVDEILRCVEKEPRMNANER